MTIEVQYQETSASELEGGYFVCTHDYAYTDTAVQDYMTFSGPAQHEFPIEVCDDCDSWYNDIEATWEANY